MKPIITALPCKHEVHSDLDEQMKCILAYKPLLAIISNDIININNVMYKNLETIHKGEYGELAIVEKDNDETYYWKYSPQGKRKLFKEAILQLLAYHALEKHGLKWAIPKIEKIFIHPEHGCGFLMSHPKDADIFANYLQKSFNWKKSCEENDKILIEVIAQISIFLCILEDTLQMNHRDLKTTNVVLIQKADDPFTLGYYRKGKRIVLNTDIKVMLVDFGFACINTGSNIIAAGNYLPTFDGCPKEGRDLFLLLANLWNVEAIRRCITPKMTLWFKKCLQGKKMSWTDHLIKIRDNTMKMVYLYTTSSEFEMPSCGASFVLESLALSFPHLLSYSVPTLTANS
jgi:serine/threonine protein kinase